MNKVYMIYLGKEFYAWTRDKKLRDQFLNFRTNKFYVTKHELDIEEYSEFAEKYYEKELVIDKVNVDGTSCNISMTKYEQGKYTAYLDTIVNSYTDAVTRLKTYVDDNKIYDIVTELDPVLQTIEDKYTGEKIVCAVIDMKEADIFYDMFPDTF